MGQVTYYVMLSVISYNNQGRVKNVFDVQTHTPCTYTTTIEQKAQVSSVWVGAGWMVEAG